MLPVLLPPQKVEALDTLRILVIGSPVEVGAVAATLESAGQEVLPAVSLSEGLEALGLQKFNAVLLSVSFSPQEVAEFSGQIKALEIGSASDVRTPILQMLSGRAEQAATLRAHHAIDGFVEENTDPETLTQNIWHLAGAVGQRSLLQRASNDPDLPVLDVEELKEQVAHDDDLLVELIDLYVSERQRQGKEMREALQAGDYDWLSRLTHTIKGSLGSLHASAAKAEAQVLELAARDRDAAHCADLLARFESKLDALDEQLLALKRTVSGR